MWSSGRQVFAVTHEFLLKADAFEKIYLRRRSFLQLKDTLSFSDGDRILLKELRGDVVTGRSILLELTEVRPGAREGYVLCSFVILFPEIEPSIRSRFTWSSGISSPKHTASWKPQGLKRGKNDPNNPQVQESHRRPAKKEGGLRLR